MTSLSVTWSAGLTEVNTRSTSTTRWRDHSGVSLGGGSAVAVVGGILITVGVAEAQSGTSTIHPALNLWGNPWFDVGLVLVALGLAGLALGLVLHFRPEPGWPVAPVSVGPQHSQELRLVMSGIASAVKGSGPVTIEDRTQLASFKAHYPWLVPPMSEWNTAVAERRDVEYKLRERFGSEALSRGITEPPYVVKTIIDVSLATTVQRALRNYLNGPWNWNGWTGFGDAIYPPGDRTSPWIILPQDAHQDIEDWRARVTDLRTVLESFVEDAQTWPEAEAIKPAQDRVDQMRDRLSEDLALAAKRERIAPSPECPVCEMNQR